MNILDTIKYQSRLSAVPFLGYPEMFVHTYQTTLRHLRFQLFRKVEYRFLKKVLNAALEVGGGDQLDRSIDRAKSEVLYRGNEERNILYSVRGRRANWIGHILRRNFLLTCVIDGKIEKWQ